MRLVAFFIVLVLQCNFAFACSFARGYEEFLYIPTEEGGAPNKPKPSVVSIKRGFNDGNFASCSDAGILVISFNEDNPRQNTGYVFELVDGSFDDRVFPDTIVSVASDREAKNEVMFVWLDGSRNYQEAIDVKVKIKAISITGVESEPTTLHIEHPGGKSH